jgi:hypothetical protein
LTTLFLRKVLAVKIIYGLVLVDSVVVEVVEVSAASVEVSTLGQLPQGKKKEKQRAKQ